MQDTPNPVDLLRAVAGFLRDHAMPQLNGHAAFHARVAANTVDIVIRQLLAQAVDQPAELHRLHALLGPSNGTTAAAAQNDDTTHPAGGSHPDELAELNRQLCERIRDGSLTLASAGLADHLWQTTLEKLAVDQPRYETYRRIQRGAA